MLQPPPSSQDKALTDEDFERIDADRRRARRRGLAWLFGGFALIFGLIVWGLVADEAPPDTSDLRVVFKHPPDEQNAYALLSKLAASLPPEPDEATPDERHFARIFSTEPDQQVAWNQAVVAAVLSRYPPDLAEQTRAALAAPECEAPEVKSYKDTIPEISRFRHLAKTLTKLSALAWHAGDHRGAADQNLLTLQLGRRISQSRGPLVTVLTGAAVQRSALGSIQAHLDDPTITADLVRSYLARIPEHEIAIIDYHTAHKLEHTGFFVIVAQDVRSEGLGMFTGGKPNKTLDFVGTLPGAYQPNRTIRWHAEFTRTLIANSDPLPPGAVDPALSQITALTEAPLHRRLQNFTGRTLLATALSWMGKVTTTGHRSRANLRLTQLYAALRLHHLEHDGALPADLSALVPTYLPAIPLDPFGGAPLRYDRDLTTIWSIDEKHISITTADGDFPERGTPAFRLRFARPLPEPPPYSEPIPADESPEG